MYTKKSNRLANSVHLTSSGLIQEIKPSDYSMGGEKKTTTKPQNVSENNLLGKQYSTYITLTEKGRNTWF